MTEQNPVVGIDLGTTNSAVSIVQDGEVVIIPVDGKQLLPSVVGLDMQDNLLVGHAARNQYLLYPERTIRSVKRQMGDDTPLKLGEQTYTPTEISAMILRKLKQAAEDYLQQSVNRAVITVPAYFSDVQRASTKEAGEIAGFTVERILNEPTAAALCYIGEAKKRDGQYLVYDLGGGTFDVSIVRTRGDVTEVLASHGDTSLGGDDFDAALLEELYRRFEDKHQLDLRSDLRAKARLTRASEDAKIALSTESFQQVIEEQLAKVDGVPLHLDEEVARTDYENLIEALLERTKDSVQTALREAKLLIRDLDDVILVGGSSQTPRVSQMLKELLDLTPRMDIDPEKAVAFGAALQAARIAGDASGRILVDITPFSFGTSYFGMLNGVPTKNCYRAIIHRNTPLPSRQTEIFYTMADCQKSVEVEIFQGEEKDARYNIQLGKFMVEGLDAKSEAGSPILFELKLDLNGILEVRVVEKHTGLAKEVIIEDAFRKLSQQEIIESRERLSKLFPEETNWSTEGPAKSSKGASLGGAPPTEDTSEEPVASATPFLIPPDGLSNEDNGTWEHATETFQKASGLLSSLDETDKEEVEEVLQRLQSAFEGQDLEQLQEISDELADILFYLE